jgi:hypothetical protein
MSKKKNTLKDLDEFLKQQAATLVSPSRLNDPPSLPSKEQPPAKEEETTTPAQPRQQHAAVSAETLLRDLQHLAKSDARLLRHQLYDLIISATEAQNQYSAEDRMLINTALYLKGGDQWKNVIREYWKNKNSDR